MIRDIEILFTPYDTAMSLVFFGLKFVVLRLWVHPKRAC